jgi:hypothetical protein
LLTLESKAYVNLMRGRSKPSITFLQSVAPALGVIVS